MACLPHSVTPRSLTSRFSYCQTGAGASLLSGLEPGHRLVDAVPEIVPGPKAEDPSRPGQVGLRVPDVPGAKRLVDRLSASGLIRA